MTEQEQEKMIKEYLDAMLDAFREKALGYYNSAGGNRDRFARVTEIKNSLRGIGHPETFGIGSGDYDHCPSGVCNGGVCTRALLLDATEFGTAELRALGQELNAS